MINRVELKNFGPIEQLDWQHLGKINLIIGKNDCGKSFLLKAIYSAVRTLEDYKRGDNPDSLKKILVDKLYWTFQTENGILGLPTNSGNAELLLNLTLEQKHFYYSFCDGSLETNDVTSLENKLVPRIDNSIFLPAKEVLSLHHLILKSRELDKVFGFDDTYLDLARALHQKPTKIMQYSSGYNSPQSGYGIASSYGELPSEYGHRSIDFNNARILLESIIGGRIEFNDVNRRWYFKKGEQFFSMGATAEGIKKIAILDTLLGNGYLNEKSVVFIDEPESNLHPEAITKLLDIVAILANHGIQFFIASHSYFVIKKLFLIAQEQQMSIPVLSYQNNEWVQSDLKEDIPDNPIVDESIRLYEEQLDLAGV